MIPRPKIAKATGRSVREWIGATPDSRPPKPVRLRVFDRHNGCDWETGEKILPGDEWDCDHKKRLADGGLNRESNLGPKLRARHREKTAKENRAGKKADRVRMRHVGIKDEPKQKIQSRGFEPAERKNRNKDDPFPGLPRRVCGVIVE